VLGKKFCPNATVSINPTWTGVGSNPGLFLSQHAALEPLVTLPVSVAVEVTANDAWPDNIRAHLRCGYRDKSDSTSYFFAAVLTPGAVD
jgi:hypothetical protein